MSQSNLSLERFKTRLLNSNLHIPALLLLHYPIISLHVRPSGLRRFNRILLFLNYLGNCIDTFNFANITFSLMPCHLLFQERIHISIKNILKIKEKNILHC